MKTKVIDICFMLLLLLSFILQNAYSLFAGVCLCGIYILVYRNRINVKKAEVGIVSLIAVICILPTLGMKHGITPLLYVPAALLTFYSAKCFSLAPIADIERSLNYTFWIFVLGILLILWIYKDAAEPLGEIVEGSSTNGIPSYLIVLQISLSLAFFLRYGRLPLFSVYFTIMVAIFGIGRASIVVAGLIFLFSVLMNAWFAKFSLLLKILVILVASLAFLIITSDIQAYHDISMNWNFSDMVVIRKLSQGLIDQARTEILTEYIQKLDFLSLIIGSDYDGTVISSRYDNNPHISFIRTHAFYGIIGLILVIASPIIILISKKIGAYKVVFFGFILLALIRATSEPIFFPTLLDFFYFLNFFMYIRFAPARYESRI